MQTIKVTFRQLFDAYEALNRLGNQKITNFKLRLRISELLHYAQSYVDTFKNSERKLVEDLQLQIVGNQVTHSDPKQVNEYKKQREAALDEDVEIPFRQLLLKQVESLELTPMDLMRLRGILYQPPATDDLNESDDDAAT